MTRYAYRSTSTITRKPGWRAGNARRVRRLSMSVTVERVSRGAAAATAFRRRARFVFRNFPLAEHHPQR